MRNYRHSFVRIVDYSTCHRYMCIVRSPGRKRQNRVREQ